MSDEQSGWRFEPAVPGLRGEDPRDPQGERVYTVKQASKATGLSEKLIRQEIEAGALPIVGLPGERRTMLRRQDLNIYIQQRVKRKVGEKQD